VKRPSGTKRALRPVGTVDSPSSLGGRPRTLYAGRRRHGQPVGRLAEDSRSVNLERTNLAHLGPGLVPDAVEAIFLDRSYFANPDWPSTPGPIPKARLCPAPAHDLTVREPERTKL
jgi:hypothetical protein